MESTIMKPSVSLIVVKKEEKRESAGVSEERVGQKMTQLAFPHSMAPLCEVLGL